MQLRRVIISGATGTIGRALVTELTKQGVHVLVLTRADSTRAQDFANNPLVSLKICDLNALDQLTNDTGMDWDAFYHFAWAGTTGAARNDVALQQSNVRAAVAAVAAAHRFGCQIFIGAGSQAEYGLVSTVIDENTPTNPVTEYGKGKLAAGKLVHEAAAKYGMHSVWVRFFSVYGPYDPSSVITTTIKKLLQKQPAQFTPATQMWNFLLSLDAAQALSLIATKITGHETVVLAHPESQPLKNYLRELADVIDPDAVLEFGVVPYVNNQVVNLQVNVQKLQRLTGWVPQHTFAAGIALTKQWLLEQ